MIPQAPITFAAGEWFFFLLANAIITWICAPRLLGDVRRWIAGGREKAFEAGQGRE